MPHGDASDTSCVDEDPGQLHRTGIHVTSGDMRRTAGAYEDAEIADRLVGHFQEPSQPPVYGRSNHRRRCDAPPILVWGAWFVTAILSLLAIGYATQARSAVDAVPSLPSPSSVSDDQVCSLVAREGHYVLQCAAPKAPKARRPAARHAPAAVRHATASFRLAIESGALDLDAMLDENEARAVDRLRRNIADAALFGAPRLASLDELDAVCLAQLEGRMRDAASDSALREDHDFDRDCLRRAVDLELLHALLE